VACYAVGGVQAASGEVKVGNVKLRFRTVFATIIFLVVTVSAFGSDEASVVVSDGSDASGQATYDQLVRQAREGDTASALIYLRQLGEEATPTQRLDHILIASWVGLGQEVVDLYQNLPANVKSALPVDGQIAVARSFRDLKQWQESLVLWHDGLVRHPDAEIRFAPGLVMTLADSGALEEALRAGEDWLSRYPGDADLRAAMAYVYAVQERTLAELADQQAELARQGEREKYDALILAARAGDVAPALNFLRGLGGLATPAQRFDHILVASWADLHDEVIRLYQAMPADIDQSVPAEVQQAVARSFRSLRRFSEALSISQAGMDQHPEQAIGFVPVLVMSLADLGRLEAAVKTGLHHLKTYPQDADLHMALAYVYTLQQLPFEVLYHTDQAINIAPLAAWVEDEYIRALTRAGMPDLALERAHRTGRFQGAALRAIEADVAAIKTRLAVMPTRSEAERFVIADRALALYDQMLVDWRKLGARAAEDLTRIRIDRLAALHARVRMDELVRDYEQLVAEGVTIPGWALSNVASAYLYLRRPEKARDLYRAVLADLEANTPTEERNHLGPANARLSNEIGLMYALIEAEQFDQLPSILARIDAYNPGWLYFKGNPQPVPNTHYLDSKVALIAADQARDDMPAAQAKLEKMVELAPENTSLRESLAGLYRARARPRLAEEHLKLAETSEPRSLGVEVGQGLVALDLQEWRQAEELSRDAITRFPENQSARRLARLWQVHNQAEFRISSNHSLASHSNAVDPVSGRGNFGVESVLYSKPMQYNWRAFIGGSHANGKYREGNGYYSTLRGGLEWRSRDLWIEGEISANRYGRGTKAGGRLSAAYDINDHWQISGSVDIFSRSTSVRALREGISANSAQFGLRWRANERREYAATFIDTRFSDDNDRLSLDLSGIERLHTLPNLKLDLLMSASIQTNSMDAQRPYFNPKRDVSLVPTVRATHKLYRRYENVWEHFASISAGVHNQKNYGTDEVWGIAYGHRYRHNDVFEVGATLDAISRPYDGRREAELRLLLDLTSRF